MPVSIYSRIFIKAAEILGGRAKLSRELQVPADALDAWIEDRAVPPLPIFLRAVDIVMDELNVRGSEEGDPPPSQDASTANVDSTRY